jgi:hypothetical protein
MDSLKKLIKFPANEIERAVRIRERYFDKKTKR